MRADIVILSRNDELAAKAVSSVAEFCDMSKIGRLVVGWTGEPRSAGLYMLTKLADGRTFLNFVNVYKAGENLPF